MSAAGRVPVGPWREPVRRHVRVPVVLALVLVLVLATACAGGEAGNGRRSGPGVEDATAHAPAGSAGDGEPVDERIVLVRDRRLLLRGPDGEERVLFSAEASNVFPTFPAWSPDGTRVAFVQSRFAATDDDDGGDDIYVIAAGGGEPRLVRRHARPGEQIVGLTWTADGGALLAGVATPEVAAHGSSAGRKRALYRVDVESGDSRVLVEGAVEPSLSRDGSRLAYLVPGDPGPGTIRVSAADGSDARPVSLPEDLDPFAPRISPDGTSVAFSAPTTGAFSARPRRADTIPATLAAVLPFGARRAEASAIHGMPMEVWRFDLDAEQPVPLTNFGEDDPRAAWEPDGAALIVLGTDGLYRVATDGSGVERLDGGAFAGQLDVR